MGLCIECNGVDVSMRYTYWTEYRMELCTLLLNYICQNYPEEYVPVLEPIFDSDMHAFLAISRIYDTYVDTLACYNDTLSKYNLEGINLLLNHSDYNGNYTPKESNKILSLLQQLYPNYEDEDEDDFVPSLIGVFKESVNSSKNVIFC